MKVLEEFVLQSHLPANLIEFDSVDDVYKYFSGADCFVRPPLLVREDGYVFAHQKKYGPASEQVLQAVDESGIVLSSMLDSVKLYDALKRIFRDDDEELRTAKSLCDIIKDMGRVAFDAKDDGVKIIRGGFMFEEYIYVDTFASISSDMREVYESFFVLNLWNQESPKFSYLSRMFTKEDFISEMEKYK